VPLPLVTSEAQGCPPGLRNSRLESMGAEPGLEVEPPRKDDALPEWEGIRIGIAERYLMVALVSSRVVIISGVCVSEDTLTKPTPFAYHRKISTSELLILTFHALL